MEVLVAGGHGKIGLRLLRLLAEGGHRARGMIRDERQAADLEAVGAHPVLCDLETDDPTPHIGGADAVAAPSMAPTAFSRSSSRRRIAS